MKRSILRLSKALYRRVGSLRVRQVLFRAFQMAVARRRVVARADGIVFDLDLGEVIDLSLYLEQFEPEVVQAITAHIRPGWVVADIGANVGAHTLRIARQVGPQGHVFAFEPTSFAFRKLVRNVGLNPFANVVPLQLALDEADRGPIRIDFRASWRWNGELRSEPTVVDAVRFDSWFAENEIGALHAIKLDVDGHEFAVLAGARETLARFRPLLVMEAGDYHFADSSRNPFTLLTSLGYEIHDLSDDSALPPAVLGQRLAELRAKGVDSVNVLCRIPAPKLEGVLVRAVEPAS